MIGHHVLCVEANTIAGALVLAAQHPELQGPTQAAFSSANFA